MKKLLAIAALLLASTAAQAQYTFEYGGRTIRVDPDRGTVSIPGVYDNSGRRSKRSRNEDSDRPRKQAPQQAKTDPQAPPAEAAVPPPAPAEQTAPAPAPAPAVAAPVPVPPASEPATTTATVAPADTDTAVVPPPSPPAAGCSASREFAARRLVDGREGRQGPDRTMRCQSLRIFRRQEVEPEWRTGSDQHEARQGQMERPDSRSEYRQHL